jgi:PadR family transcriptional regulator PadR
VEALTKESEGVFELGQSTLYPMLYNLESKGLVASKEKPGPNGRMRRYYRLTIKGKKKLGADRQQWANLVKGMSALGLTRDRVPTNELTLANCGLATDGGGHE